ncbi:hypothetical protein L1987_46677 [Smallanthus sonchifolius]|uniref:Uncharacterized protein n=1 Tax=Smallanthus sonchifolius TaxID=185202 RepID=A0ACB9G0G6_9ASTR|nr:hypothetical protein L1987_46677 [Smallanthus sonchifolius]
MLGFTNGETYSESSTESDSDDGEDDNDGDDDNVDGDDGANADVVVYISSPAPHADRVHSPPPGASDTMPSWALTSEIKRLKKKNFKLAHYQVPSSKPFKRLIKGPSKPSYKNFRVSSSSSESDGARRQGKKDDESQEDDEQHLEDADYAYFSPNHQQFDHNEEIAIIPEVHEQAEPEISISKPNENIEPINVSVNVSVKDKGKAIATEEEKTKKAKLVEAKQVNTSESEKIPDKYVELYEKIDNDNEKFLEHGCGRIEDSEKEQLEDVNMSDKSEEPIKFEFFSFLEDKSYNHFEEVMSEEAELKSLTQYVKEHRLVATDTGLRHLRYVVKKHQAYQFISKGTLPIIDKPSPIVPNDEEQEKSDLIKAFVKMGYKEELLAKSSRNTLRKMMTKLKESREEKENLRKQQEFERIQRDKETKSLKKMLEQRHEQKQEVEIHKQGYTAQVDALQRRWDSILVFKRSTGEHSEEKGNEELLVERGGQESIRVYDPIELKWLYTEDTFALESIKIVYEPRVDFAYKCIRSFADRRRHAMKDLRR